MKRNQPFNPIPLPEDLNLNAQAAAAGATPSASGGEGASGQASRKAGKRQAKGASTAKTARPRASGHKKKSRPTYQQIKDFLNRKLSGVDPEKLKQVLRACGIAAGIITALILALKFFPLGALLLALLTTAAAMRLWDRLSQMGSLVL